MQSDSKMASIIWSQAEALIIELVTHSQSDQTGQAGLVDESSFALLSPNSLVRGGKPLGFFYGGDSKDDLWKGIASY